MYHCPRCCSIFTQGLITPKVLPCGHTYCFQCIQKNCNTYHILFYHYDIGCLKRSFTCDKCDFMFLPEQLRSLPTNYYLFEETPLEDSGLSPFQQRSMSTSRGRSQLYEFVKGEQEINQPEFVMSQTSMSQGCHSQTINPFNFMPMQDLIEVESSQEEVDYSNFFQTPRKTKDPNLCQNEGCYNVRMYYKGAKIPFCGPRCPKGTQQNATTSGSSARQSEKFANNSVFTQINPFQGMSMANNQQTFGNKDCFVQQQVNFPQMMEDNTATRFPMAFGQVSKLAMNKNVLNPRQMIMTREHMTRESQTPQSFFGYNIDQKDKNFNGNDLMRSAVSNSAFDKMLFPTSFNHFSGMIENPHFMFRQKT